MRRLLLASLLLLTGCAGTTGPRMRAAYPQNPLSPNLSLQEQRQRVLANTAFPDPATPNVGPRSYAEIPAELYGQRGP